MTSPERFANLPDYAFPRLRTLLGADVPHAATACRALGLLNWRAAHRFCGACGGALADHAVEVPRGLHLHAGGNLFREKFDQQLGHVQAFTVSASDFTALPPSFSTQASAHILVRSRMRPM